VRPFHAQHDTTEVDMDDARTARLEDKRTARLDEDTKEYAEERTKEFVRVWDAIANRAGATLQEEWGVMTTIAPPDGTIREIEQLRVTLRDLPMVKMSETMDPAEDIWLRDTLGQGGMGVVYLGRQRTLDRDVAIKTLREDRDAELAKREILREAWITGRIEHPNVIPIHSLGLDRTGRPIIIMKRVEGRSWAEAILDPTTLPETYAGMDPLEAHLNILIQVCNAIHFAHTRQVLHRDIKPDNVMLGEFGEVYVLDWGIAVSMDERDAGKLPLASEVTELAGTPGYMAPEMVEPDGRTLSERTDVYLLGAVLHEIITGRARHHANSMRAAILSSFVSAPFDYSATSAPAELGQIANLAMRKDPAERIPSADALRGLLVEFLNHRESHQLREEADRRAQAGRDMVARGFPEDDADLTRALRQHVTEAMFGYQQAITLWPGNTTARASLRAFIVECAAFEIARGDLVAAEGLVSRLGTVPDELVANLEALRAQRAREQVQIEEARRLKRDGDVSVSGRARAVVAILVLVVWTVAGIAKGVWNIQGVGDVAVAWLAAGVVTLIVLAFRASLLTTALNRRVMSLFLVAVYGQAAMRLLGTVFMGLSEVQCVAMENMLSGAVIAHIGVSIDNRVLAIAPVMPLGGLLTANFPEHGVLFNNLSNLLVFGGFAFLWSRKMPKIE
jgi:serine/threonine-protein kinase